MFACDIVTNKSICDTWKPYFLLHDVVEKFYGTQYQNGSFS